MNYYIIEDMFFAKTITHKGLTQGDAEKIANALNNTSDTLTFYHIKKQEEKPKSLTVSVLDKP